MQDLDQRPAPSAAVPHTPTQDPMGQLGWIVCTAIAVVAGALAIPALLLLAVSQLASDGEQLGVAVLALFAGLISLPIGYLSALAAVASAASDRQDAYPNHQRRAVAIGAVLPLLLIGGAWLVFAMLAGVERRARDHTDITRPRIELLTDTYDARWTTQHRPRGWGLSACVADYSESTSEAAVNPNHVGSFLTMTEELLVAKGFVTNRLGSADGGSPWYLTAASGNELLEIRATAADTTGEIEIVTYGGPCIDAHARHLLGGLPRADELVTGWDLDQLNAQSEAAAGLQEAQDLSNPEGWWRTTYEPLRHESSLCVGASVTTDSSMGLGTHAGANQEAFDWITSRPAAFEAEGWDVQSSRLVFEERNGPDTERWLLFAVKGEEAIALTAVFTYWETTEQYAASAQRRSFSGPCIERFGLDLATKAPWYDEQLVRPALNELPDLDD